MLLQLFFEVALSFLQLNLGLGQQGLSRTELALHLKNEIRLLLKSFLHLKELALVLLFLLAFLTLDILLLLLQLRDKLSLLLLKHLILLSDEVDLLLEQSLLLVKLRFRLHLSSGRFLELLLLLL